LSTAVRGRTSTRRGAWLASLATIILAGCGSAGESAVTPVPTSAASSPVAPSPTASAGPSADPSASAAPEPTVVGEGVVSTDDEEWRISFTPDGETAYFARSDGFFPQTRDATIMETTLVDGAWSEPVVASFSGEFPDIDPWVSPDGERIYFSSIRPVDGEPREDVELFRVDREGDGWSEPIHLSALGSEADELGLSVAADGTAVFASDRSDGGDWDLFSAAADGDGFVAPLPIDELNSDVWEFNPAIDASGTVLLFTSIGRPGGSGLGDLFVTTRDGGPWAASQPLPVNGRADEYHPSLSPDGSTLYFVRRSGHGDLLQVDWAAVDPTD
jgi:Tol biopolymer transport system component